MKTNDIEATKNYLSQNPEIQAILEKLKEEVLKHFLGTIVDTELETDWDDDEVVDATFYIIVNCGTAEATRRLFEMFDAMDEEMVENLPVNVALEFYNENLGGTDTK